MNCDCTLKYFSVEFSWCRLRNERCHNLRDTEQTSWRETVPYGTVAADDNVDLFGHLRAALIEGCASLPCVSCGCANVLLVVQSLSVDLAA